MSDYPFIDDPRDDGTIERSPASVFEEADADDPSCWEPEIFVEHKYGKLFCCEEQAEYEDVYGIEGSFYHIEPNSIHVLVELGPNSSPEDKLCLSFSVYTKFVFHTDEKLCRSVAEVSVELLNGESKSIHEFDFCESKEWDHWPEPVDLKYWIINTCSMFLRDTQAPKPLTVEDVI